MSRSSKSSKGTYSQSGLSRKFEAKRQKQEMLQAAAAWCRETGQGPWMAAKEFEGVTAEQIRYHIMKERSGKRNESDILTEIEEERLVQWIEQSSDNLNAASISASKT